MEKYLQNLEGFFHFLLPLFSIEQINETAILNFLLKKSCQIKGGNTGKIYESSPESGPGFYAIKKCFPNIM